MNQLDLFTSFGAEPLAAPTVTPAEENATSRSTEPASRPEQTDHAGEPGDDGSLHFMATGKPEPVKARTGTCRNCHAEILWARTETKRWMPLNPDPVDATTETGVVFVLRDTGSTAGPTAISAWGLEGTEPHFRSHFDTCAAKKDAA